MVFETKVAKKQLGFTVIENLLILAIFIIMACIAIPHVIHFSKSSKESVTQESLSQIRHVLAVKFAAAQSEGKAQFPAELTPEDFEEGVLPVNQLTLKNEIHTVSEPQLGYTQNDSYGFWYIQKTGVAGAYSDGLVDVSEW